MKKIFSISLALILASPLAFGASLRVPDTSGKIREYTITSASIVGGKLSILADAVERRKPNERESEYFNATIESLAKQGLDAVSLLNLIANDKTNTYLFCHIKNFEPNADQEFICDNLNVSAIMKR